MPEFEISVLIVESNATRADLYAHWLPEFEVRTALTKRQVSEKFDDDVAVVVLDQDFADGAAEEVLSWIRSCSRFCRILTTTEERGRVFPKLDVDTHLVEPISEDDLREEVGRLARQAVYSTVLGDYYRTTVELASLQDRTKSPDVDREATLEDRVSTLKDVLNDLRASLDEADMYAVMDLVKPERDRPTDDLADETSKYVPKKCSNCDRQWGVGRGTDPSKGAVRLGSHVWRCVECGHVQMGAGAGNPRLTHSH